MSTPHDNSTEWKHMLPLPRRRRAIDLLKAARIERERPHIKATTPRRTRPSRAVPESLFDEQEGRCHYCGVLMRADVPDRAPTRDHIYPVSLGGSGARENLVAACAWCNNKKGHMLYGDFLVRLSKLNPRHHHGDDAFIRGIGDAAR